MHPKNTGAFPSSNINFAKYKGQNFVRKGHRYVSEPEKFTEIAVNQISASPDFQLLENFTLPYLVNYKKTQKTLEQTNIFTDLEDIFTNFDNYQEVNNENLLFVYADPGMSYVMSGVGDVTGNPCLNYLLSPRVLLKEFAIYSDRYVDTDISSVDLVLDYERQEERYLREFEIPCENIHELDFSKTYDFITTHKIKSITKKANENKAIIVLQTSRNEVL